MMRLNVFLLLTFILLAGCIQAPAEDTFMGGQPGEEGAMDEGTIQDEPSIRSGNGTPYVPFTQSGYDKARSEGKVIFLEFYANWCPVCARQEPKIEEAFASINYSDVTGFRVNYKDSDTDDDERNMAKEFGIVYQHTHVILDPSGNVVSKSGEVWEKDRIISEIQSARGA